MLLGRIHRLDRCRSSLAWVPGGRCMWVSAAKKSEASLLSPAGLEVADGQGQRTVDEDFIGQRQAVGRGNFRLDPQV